MNADPGKGARDVEDEDERLAVRHHAPLLITAESKDAVLIIARRVHAVTFGVRAPLVKFRAGSVARDRRRFESEWNALMHAARGGSVLVTDVEQLSSTAQQLCTEFMALMRRSGPAVTPRLMSGTTVSLIHRVRAGMFSEDLLYRINVIHVTQRRQRD